MELKEYLLLKFQGEEPSTEGFSIGIDDILDYCISVYKKRDDNAPLNKLKEEAIARIGIKKKDAEILMLNKSLLISRIVTEILRITADRDFELYISALEASTILLEVVRRPIDDDLEDEKWATALKAKKQGFLDARELIKNAKDILENMTGIKDSDAQDHVEEVIFKEGLSERLAKKASK